MRVTVVVQYFTSFEDFQETEFECELSHVGSRLGDKIHAIRILGGRWINTYVSPLPRSNDAFMFRRNQK